MKIFNLVSGEMTMNKKTPANLKLKCCPWTMPAFKRSVLAKIH